MSNPSTKLVHQYWLEISDLTIFEAAFWMVFGDPLLHERIYPTKDNSMYINDIDDLRHMAEDFCDRDLEWRMRTDEKGEVIASAIRASLIRVTLDKVPYDPYIGHIDEFRSTRINKSDWIDWCQHNGYEGLADSFRPTSSDTQIHAKKLSRTPVAKQQNEAILNWLTKNKHNPQNLIVPPPGKAGIKKECRDSLCKSSKELIPSSSVFDTAWERLRANGEIQDAKK